MTISQDEYNKFTQFRLEKAISENKNRLEGSQRKKLTGSMIFRNSLNILVGKQGSGKTATTIKEIIKITENSKETHLLIYVNKSGTHNDMLFESTKDLIRCPILYVSHDDAENFLIEFFKNKALYEEAKDIGALGEMPQDMLDELRTTLYLEPRDYDFLHTIILFEDTANSPLLKKDYIRDILAKCRHYKVTCFLLVQFWKSLPSAVKENASLIFLFGGFPPRAFYYVVSQVYTSEDHQELFQKYKKLDNTDMLVFDTYTGNVSVLTRDG